MRLFSIRSVIYLTTWLPMYIDLLKIINILIVYPQLDAEQKAGVGLNWMMFIMKSLIDYIRNHISFNPTKHLKYTHALKLKARNSNFSIYIYIYNKNISDQKKKQWHEKKEKKKWNKMTLELLIWRNSFSSFSSSHRTVNHFYCFLYIL
jgi:hypothetical protein